MLESFCTKENVAWESPLVTAFHYLTEDNTSRTVLRYQIPFPADKEKLFMERYGLPASKRMEFYQTLVRCIQQQIKASAHLIANEVSSILPFHEVEQIRTEDGTTNIYLSTERVTPIQEKLLRGQIDAIDAVNVLLRLSIILRDANKEPASLTIRGLDIHEVYMTEDNKILLGGLYYAGSPNLPEPPGFLPSCSSHVFPTVLQGGIGDPGTDMYSLACLGWNLFSGLPLEVKLPDHLLVFPQYASQELAECLWIGRSGDADKVAAFRRKLSESRKQMGKDPELQKQKIPLPKQRKKQFEIQIV